VLPSERPTWRKGYLRSHSRVKQVVDGEAGATVHHLGWTTTRDGADEGAAPLCHGREMCQRPARGEPFVWGTAPAVRHRTIPEVERGLCATRGRGSRPYTRAPQCYTHRPWVAAIGCVDFTARSLTTEQNRQDRARLGERLGVYRRATAAWRRDWRARKRGAEVRKPAPVTDLVGKTKRNSGLGGGGGNTQAAVRTRRQQTGRRGGTPSTCCLGA
jgi:hypothetical protein